MSDIALWGAPEWTIVSLAILATGGLALLWSYWSAPASRTVRCLAAALKFAGLLALTMCLIEPLLSSMRPRAGANVIAIVADDSQSLEIHDPDSDRSRGERLQDTLLAETNWQTRLGQDFDVRRFQFDTQLRAVKDFSGLTFTGDGTALSHSLSAVANRFRGLPVGGVLLLTDGNSTDSFGNSFDWSELPRVYPVVIGDDDAPADVSVAKVTVSETNFESAPVTVGAEIRARGIEGSSVSARLLAEDGRPLESQVEQLPEGQDTLSFRFQLQPDTDGLSFYRVQADADDDNATDATQANNERMLAVDRGNGPYRVLYVCGRPNWDFKFLRRALAGDDQLELVGLVRIANREPKFTFRRRGQESTNQLFEGFRHEDEEAAERYDEPVLLRLGTVDDEELRDGFPQAADQLYRYDAIILDDVDAEFFNQDQLTLIESFVSRRGGGFLMLSGLGSFGDGDYRRTPVANILPVYLDTSGPAGFPPDTEFRLTLTREGWLQPWVRLRQTEQEDRNRLAAMNSFRTTNRVGNLKPGATELAQVTASDGENYPALVAQRYGRGRSAALLIGDLWRWGMRRSDEQNQDLQRSWRQTVRWLVADVPRRVEVEARKQQNQAANSIELRVRVHDREYLPLENANIEIQVAGPGDAPVQLRAHASRGEAGNYLATHISRKPGAYRASVKVSEPDGTPIEEREIGWVAEPLANEFDRLRPNRELLGEIAQKTRGEVVKLDELDQFVSSLPTREMPVTEPWIRPLWHHPMFFVFAIACLIGEWGLRRWKGLA